MLSKNKKLEISPRIIDGVSIVKKCIGCNRTLKGYCSKVTLQKGKYYVGKVEVVIPLEYGVAVVGKICSSCKARNRRTIMKNIKSQQLKVKDYSLTTSLNISI